VAYTTPTTAVTGAVAPASMWNTGVRDNLLAMMHPIAVKANDESVTSSAVLQPDNDLILPVGANEVWQFLFHVIEVAGTTGDLQIGFTFPTAGEISASVVAEDNAGTLNVTRWIGTTTPTPGNPFRGTTNAYVLPITGIFVNSTNAGNLTMQWAQNTSDGTATTVKKYSTLWAARLA